MTPITARALLQEWLDTNSLEGQYVTLAEYEAMRQKRLELGETVSRLMDDNYSLVAGLAKVNDDNEKLKAILQRWLELGPQLPYGEWSAKELSQLR